MDAEIYRKELIKTPDELIEISGKIIGLSIKVHKALGPGMLERLLRDGVRRVVNNF